jgi:hypothetical protein
MCARFLFISAFSTAFVRLANPSTAQDANSAKAFWDSVFRLYQNHGNGIGFNLSYLHSSLVSLIRADIKAAGTEEPIVGGGDLVCGCQEWDGIWVLKMDVNVESSRPAQGVVSFALYAPKDRPKDD